jgi:uncharacterized DUF497 family protein
MYYAKGEHLRIDAIIWNSWNKQHIERHSIKTCEVIDILQEESGKSLFESSRKDRLFASGVTSSGRYLIVIMASAGTHRFYPITSREMTVKERRRYKKWLQKKT